MGSYKYCYKGTAVRYLFCKSHGPLRFGSLTINGMMEVWTPTATSSNAVGKNHAAKLIGGCRKTVKALPTVKTAKEPRVTHFASLVFATTSAQATAPTIPARLSGRLYTPVRSTSEVNR